MRLGIVAAAGAASIAHAGFATAAQTCAATASAIQSALTVGVNNGEDDTIRIVAGSYPLSTGLTFTSTEAHSLTLSGGWNAGCTEQGNADTTLNGQDMVPPLDVYNANGSVRVEHLIFASGKAGVNLGDAAISLQSNNQSVYVDFNQFTGNHAAAGPAALYAYAGSGTLYVRNNLVLGNHGAIVGGISASMEGGTGYLTGNTIVANVTDAQGTAGGMEFAGTGYFYVSNNIIWNNAGTGTYDFVALVAHRRFANDIGSVGTGTAPDQVSGEQYVDPQFVQCGFLCFSFELSPTSPLVDAGVDAPGGGQLATDLAGKPRILGPHVDIGAYENEVIFLDGFE